MTEDRSDQGLKWMQFFLSLQYTIIITRLINVFRLQKSSFGRRKTSFVLKDGERRLSPSFAVFWVFTRTPFYPRPNSSATCPDADSFKQLQDTSRRATPPNCTVMIYIDLSPKNFTHIAKLTHFRIH